MDKIKNVWTDQDFDIMGWHDCRLYGMRFLKEEYAFEIDIDYIFKWNLKENQEYGHEFTVAPCLLKFFDYSKLEINIPWRQTYDVIINEIRRGDSVPSANNKALLTEYQIILETGFIKLQACGFEMNILTKPIKIDSQDLGLEFRKSLISKD